MKIIDSKSLGNVIRARRKELHYTQQDITDNTGYSISFLSDLENGKPTAEIGRAIDVVNLLGLDIMIKERKS